VQGRLIAAKLGVGEPGVADELDPKERGVAHGATGEVEVDEGGAREVES
jgi:hypothetical protein